MRSVRSEDENCFAARGKNVSEVVDLKAVGPAKPRGACHVQQQPPLPKRVILAYRVSQPRGPVRIAIGKVKRLLVGRKRDTVGSSELVEQQFQIALFRKAINTAERKLASRIIELPRQSERRIGKVNSTVGSADEVVGAIQPPAVVAVGEHRLAGSSRSLKPATTSSAASDEIRASNRGSRRSMRPELPSLTIAHPYPQRHCSLMRAAAQALPGRQLIPLPGPLFSLGLEHRPSHDGVGRFSQCCKRSRPRLARSALLLSSTVHQAGKN